MRRLDKNTQPDEFLIGRNKRLPFFTELSFPDGGFQNGIRIGVFRHKKVASSIDLPTLTSVILKSR
jgi:hypothetical protein